MDFQLRIQNKLRSMNVSWECLTPIVLLPASIYVAALGRELTLLIFLALPLLFCVLYRRYLKMQYRSRFFYVWTLWSIFFGYILFQSTVPMIELLPEENILFLLFLVLTVFLFYKTKSHAFNKAYWPTVISNESAAAAEKLLTPAAMDDESSDKDPSDIEATAGSSSAAGSAGPGRVYQCTICQIGVPELDHHSVWLDCCIGGTNRKFFLLGCFMALITLLLEANLSLTSICHPYLIADVFGVHILMPDDCSDVYDQYDLAVCFVTSVYCLMMAIYVLLTILNQVFLISKGVTATERKLNIPGKAQKWSVYRNWMHFIRN